ncbi:MAG: 3-phosphoshikimate 1-carboxyvinyltransferase [Phycisphaeraceae bacterium]|nr:MAG: 3-phosphoshikimate 1-carboxyvinyltransferase [Phycisphaeraceae bacterium]
MTTRTDLAAAIEDLPDPLHLPAPAGRGAAPFRAVVTPPGSKSLTNRALLLAALCRGTSTITGALTDADDARRMIEALTTLGATVERAGTTLRVTGVGGAWTPAGAGDVVLDLNNAGTATRFLAAASLLSPRPVVIDGNARMRQRPIGELGEMLEGLGAGVTYLADAGRPPVRVVPPAPLDTTKTVDIPTTQSSQFVSALLLIAPWLPHGLTLRLSGEVTSASYIAMTIGLLQRLGATVRASADLRVVRVGPARDGAGRPVGLPAFEYHVEPDASGATYFWAAASLVRDAKCRVLGLDSSSLQGDSRFTDLLARMGCEITVSPASGGSPGWIECAGPDALQPVMADMSDMPDAAMTLAVVAAFAPGTSVLRGLRTLRVKESDRIEAMRAELAKIGVECKSPVFGDSGAMTITPPRGGVSCSADAPPVAFDTYDDHRIAMSLALVSLRRPNIRINHPACVAKTYPTFWADFAGLA